MTTTTTTPEITAEIAEIVAALGLARFASRGKGRRRMSLGPSVPCLLFGATFAPKELLFSPCTCRHVLRP